MVISYVHRCCFCLRKRKKNILRKVVLLAYKHSCPNTHTKVQYIHSVYWRWEAIACSFNLPNDCIRMRWINWFVLKSIRSQKKILSRFLICNGSSNNIDFPWFFMLRGDFNLSPAHIIIRLAIAINSVRLFLHPQHSRGRYSLKKVRSTEFHLRY